MTRALTITGPNQIAYDAETIAPWAHPGTICADSHQLVLRACALLYNVQLNTYQWNPHPGELKLALVALVAMGLDLAPSAQECALLSFKNRKTGQHSVTPVAMKNGLRRIASELHPIVGEQSGVVVEGDEWWCKRTHQGLAFEHQAAENAHRTSLVAASGALNFEPVRALYTTIFFADGRTFSEVLDGQRLHEKLRTNRNAQSAGKQNKWGKVQQSPWLTNTWAMLEKTSVKHTYQRLPLRGRPAAAMRLDSMAEGHKLDAMRAMLLAEGRVRNLPAAAMQDVEAIDVQEHESDNGEDVQRGYEFDAQPATTVIPAATGADDAG